MYMQVKNSNGTSNMSDRMILGENVFYSTDCDETGLNNNVIVCGGTGCGKTMSISEPLLLETFNQSLIVTLTKRRLVDKYMPVFKKRGYRVMDLNFAHPALSSISYDPLKYIKDNQDIHFLAESIVKAHTAKVQTKADPFWDESATSLLSAEIAFCRETMRVPTFVDVLKLHSQLDFESNDSNGDGITTNMDDKFNYLKMISPNSYALSCWKSFKQLPMRTAGCVYSSLNITIDKIFSPELKQSIEALKSVDFKDLSTNKTILFVTTSPVNPAMSSYANMFYAQAFKSLFEYAETLPQGRLPIPVHVLCDDFATGSRILNFPEYISIFREKGISVTLLVQSESQLESMYGAGDATTIINNCDTYLYMGGMDLKTGGSVSKRMNAPLEDILSMPIGQEYIFRRGAKPITTRRYNIRMDKRYQEITRAYEENINARGRAFR